MRALSLAALILGVLLIPTALGMAKFEHDRDVSELERKLALLRASWAYLDAVAARVAEVRPGPRGGGRDRARLLRHANGAEIEEFARKVGVATPEHVWREPERYASELQAHREGLVAAIRDHHARGAPARNWTLPFLIRHSAYHMLDHAWEMEDRAIDPSAAGQESQS